MSTHYPPSYMAKKNIAEICHYCNRLQEIVDEGEVLPQWIDHKISQMRTHMGDVKHYLEYEKEMRHKHHPHRFSQNPAAQTDANGRPLSPIQMHLQRQGGEPTFVPRDPSGAPANGAGHPTHPASRPHRPQFTAQNHRAKFRDQRQTQGLGHRDIDQVDRFGRPQSPVHASLREQREAKMRRQIESRTERPGDGHLEQSFTPSPAAEIARLAIGGPERRLTLNGAKSAKRRRNFTRKIDAHGMPYPFPPSSATFRPSQPLQQELRQQYEQTFKQGHHMGANNIAPWAGRAGLSSNCGSRYAAHGSPTRTVKRNSKKSKTRKKRRGLLGLFRK